ncbi:hypothetical protein HK100_005114 [Physocladia obscura]|uniref:non-specific serine/threonine protein kinase n=1 Tax=Physocladia obscura TaxID=109957 RepID=A0AAD5SUA3_9FUNG|nr:hypothetical protein HK100_005114 [Physocladia obscura]
MTPFDFLFLRHWPPSFQEAYAALALVNRQSIDWCGPRAGFISETQSTFLDDSETTENQDTPLLSQSPHTKHNRPETKLPSAFASLKSLTDLSITRFSFGGEIPAAIFHSPTLSQTLTSLNLSFNNLTGHLDASIANLANLTRLSLVSNGLSGSIPAAIGSLQNLQQLDLEDNHFSGTIPKEIANLVHMQHLNLNQNNLSALPHEISKMKELRSLDCRSNMLKGSIPASFGQLQNLRRLNLSNNFLHGSIPPELGDLHCCIYLLLSHNMLSGDIPHQLCNLGRAAFISLDNNALCGDVPTQLIQMPHLIRFRYHGNPGLFK